MGTASIDLRTVDTSERQVFLGGSSHATGSSSKNPQTDESKTVGKFEDRLRSAMRQTSAKGHETSGTRFQEENQRLKFSYHKGKRNDKKSAGCKRRLHTTASSRRFWNLFEFSLKEEATGRDFKKCPSSKEIVSSSLLSNEFESVSRNRASLSAGSGTTPHLNPKIHVYQFDEKSSNVKHSRIPRPLSQPDNLVSLLDGNPVPRTMKWKLKGYKTLRHEQSSDFAFVPGANCYDLDILSRSEPKERNEDTMNENTLCLTTKAIENKQNDVQVEKKVTQPESNATLNPVSSQTSTQTMQRLLTTSVPKKDDQFIPISKSKLSQPSVQYSSHPPKKISKPLPPGMEAKRDEHMEDARRPPRVDKPASAPSAESYQQQASENYRSSHEESFLAHGEVSENAHSEWSSMEQPRPTDHVQANSKQSNNSQQMSSTMPENKLKEKMMPSSMETPSSSYSKPSESTYFAPRPWKYTNLPKSSLSPKFDSKPTYESILGVPPKSSSMKITNPYEKQPVTISPCAATQARLQEAAKQSELQTKSQNESQSQEAGSSGFSGSSMAGGSSGGSRKPPASYPPFSTKRSSSNASCLQKKVPENASGKAANKNSTSNISTSSANMTPKKCGDRDERDEGKVICTKPRQNKCGRQRRRCDRKEKKEQKVCKRYCCPALHLAKGCDFESMSPKDGKGYNKKQKRVKSQKTDPTCLPMENEKEQGREICTKPRRRRECKRERSCERERSCSGERRRRSCSRERSCKRERSSNRQQSCERERSCSRNRNRSCKRQERRDCSRNRESQGREICTKPRKRNSCNRRRCSDQNCSRRPAKCSGRRNYTYSAFTGRRLSSQNIKRYSSLPAFAFSLIGMKANSESKQTMFDPIKGRFYGKKPPSCKSPKSESKCEKPASSSDVKCKAPKKTESKCKPAKKTENKCQVKKSESICKPVRKTESICKPVKKTESICKPVKKTESKCKIEKKTDNESICKRAKKTKSKCIITPKKQEPCKAASKSDDYCAKKREKICKERKSAVASSSKDESMKDRIEREKKEMEECKKHIKRNKKDKEKKKEEKVVAKGLERVVSPCKQKQTKKSEKDPSKKISCIGVPFNCLISNTMTNVASMPEHKPFNILPERNYSMMRSSFEDFQLEKSESRAEKKFWSFYEDDDIAVEPIPVEIDNQEEPFNESNSHQSSWFLSWFNNDRS